MTHRHALIPLVLLARLALAGAPAERPTYVEDRLGVLPAEAAAELTGYLQELDQNTSARIMVVIVPNVGGTNIDEAARNMAAERGLGAAGLEKSALIIISLSHRLPKIVVGPGLTRTLTPAFIDLVIEQFLDMHAPHLLYTDDLRSGILAIINRVAESEAVALTGMPVIAPTPAPTGPRDWTAALAVIAALAALAVIVVLLLVILRRRKRNRPE